MTLTVDTDPGTMAVDTSIDEGAGATSVKVTATLDDAVIDSATTVTLTFGGTATRGTTDDYTASGTLSVTIPAGRPSGDRTITITPREELSDDGDETIIIGATLPNDDEDDDSLSSVTPASAITLTDNDDAPTEITLTVVPTTIREQGPAGEEDTQDTEVEIIATFSGTNDNVTRIEDTHVTLSVVDASSSNATRNTDYSVPVELGDGNADITIEDGTLSGRTTFTFTSIQDNVNEGDETIVIAGSATGFTIPAANRASITLSDDDAPSTSITITASADELAEGDTTTTLTVTAELDGAASTSNIEVTLKIVTPAAADLPAGKTNANRGADKDYTVSDNLTDTVVDIIIDATDESGQTTMPVTIRPRVDGVDDDNEIIRLSADTDATAITTVNHQDIEIIDNETASMVVTLTKVSGLDTFNEDHGAGIPYTVQAELDGEITRSVDTPVTLSFGGTAGLGTCGVGDPDFSVSPASPMFSIGAEDKTGRGDLTITPCDNETSELIKTINFDGLVDFGDGFPVTVDSGFSVQLVDDEIPIVTLSAKRTEANPGDGRSVTEGDAASFVITASRETSRTTQPVRVSLSVQDEGTTPSSASTTGSRAWERSPSPTVPRAPSVSCALQPWTIHGWMATRWSCSAGRWATAASSLCHP